MAADAETAGPDDDELLSECCDAAPTENWRERQRKEYEVTAKETRKLNKILDQFFGRSIVHECKLAFEELTIKSPLPPALKKQLTSPDD